RGNRPLRPRARLHPLRGDPLARPRRGGLTHGGRSSRPPASRRKVLRGSGRRRPERQVQRVAVSSTAHRRSNRRNSSCPHLLVSKNVGIIYLTPSDAASKIHLCSSFPSVHQGW